MKKTFFAVALSTVFFAVGAYAQSGVTTRYWDGCKPSCGWTDNASGSPNGICKSCNVSGAVISNDGEGSACTNGSAFTCMKQAPWAVDDNMSYGFVANNKVGCGKCVEFTFTNTSISGKKMTVMVSNFGNLGGDAHFDIMIPGGGVGDFDALSRQIQQNGGSSSDLGVRYGGFRAKCGADATCIRNMCNTAFGTAGLADLKAGCEWYIDWFKMADNPNVTYKEVTCPQALIDKYKGNFSANPNPPAGNTYTLTVTKSHDGAGTTTPASSQANIAAGTSINLSTTVNTGYTFTNWTVTSGTATINNANNATGASVTVNGNITVRANFAQNASTYTLTVNRNPTAGGTTTPASNQSNINAGAQVDISANAASGYTFSNWTISGSGTLANANSASTKVTVNGNVTVTANFTQNPTQYTLTVTRSPNNNAGAVKVNNNDYTAPITVAGGASTPISATAASGYTFTNWTVSGNAQIDNANSASTSVKLSANSTITANFTQNPTTPTTYTLTVSRLPDNGAGTVKVNSADYSAPVSVNGGTAVNIAATAATEYRFSGWTVATGTASIANASSATTTITLTSNATVTANFTATTVVTPPSSGNGKDTIKVEAENYKSNIGSGMQTGAIEGGGTCIGYIENNYSTTYDVNVPQTGEYVMQFRIATGTERSSFTVMVDGQNVGTVSTNNTGGWDTYVTVALSSKVKFDEGNNTVVLNFQNAVNVDYFLLIGDKPAVVEPPVDPPVDPPVISVKYNPSANGIRAQVALRPTVRGFIAALPAGHGFTSYRVIDLQGREVRAGRIGGSDADLSVSNLKHSVVFLRLEGKGRTPLSLKVVTY